MNGGKQQAITTSFNLPTDAEPLAKLFLDKARVIATDSSYNSYFGNYTDTHDLPYAPYQRIDGYYAEVEGLNALGNRGVDGNTNVNHGDSYLRDILDGSYFYGVSFLSNDGVITHNEFATMLDVVVTKPTDTFAVSIRPLIGGSPYLMGDLSGENIAYNLTASTHTRYNERTMAMMYYKNSRMEKDRQISVLNLAVDYAFESIKNADIRHEAGLKYRLYLHGRYKTQYELWQDEITEAVRRVEVLGNALGRLTNAQVTRTDEYHKPSPISGMAAGAMAGAPLAVATGGASIAIGAALGFLSTQ